MQLQDFVEPRNARPKFVAQTAIHNNKFERVFRQGLISEAFQTVTVVDWILQLSPTGSESTEVHHFLWFESHWQLDNKTSLLFCNIFVPLPRTHGESFEMSVSKISCDRSTLRFTSVPKVLSVCRWVKIFAGSIHARAWCIHKSSFGKWFDTIPRSICNNIHQKGEWYE